MTVELIAKYLRNTEISPEILYQKFLEKDGVTNTQEVQIRQRKDRKLRSESVNSHLKILFDISWFDVIEREIIASLSGNFVPYNPAILNKTVEFFCGFFDST